uniref:Uncharacterized protein n=1 Tax=Arundo donax TaxID=35708 RepID=A0A0A8YS33_ARUDO
MKIYVELLGCSFSGLFSSMIALIDAFLSFPFLFHAPEESCSRL